MLLWTGCLASFLASPHQQLLTKRLPTVPAWSIFALCLPCSWWLNLQFYSPAISAILVLVSIMLMWPTIVLCHGHLRARLLPFALAGGVTCTAIIMMIHSGLTESAQWSGVMHVV